MITLGYSHNSKCELQLPDKQYRVQQMYDITVVAIIYDNSVQIQV